MLFFPVFHARNYMDNPEIIIENGIDFFSRNCFFLSQRLIPPSSPLTCGPDMSSWRPRLEVGACTLSILLPFPFVFELDAPFGNTAESATVSRAETSGATIPVTPDSLADLCATALFLFFLLLGMVAKGEGTVL